MSLLVLVINCCTVMGAIAHFDGFKK